MELNKQAIEALKTMTSDVQMLALIESHERLRDQRDHLSALIGVTAHDLRDILGVAGFYDIEQQRKRLEVMREQILDPTFHTTGIGPFKTQP